STCFDDNTANLDKFWEKIASLTNIDKKWKDTANKEFNGDELKYTIFQRWKSEFRWQNEMASILIQVLERHGCRYYFKIIGEIESEKINAAAVRDFGIIKDLTSWIMGLDRLDYPRFAEDFKNEWDSYYEKNRVQMGFAIKEEVRETHSQLLKMVKNALTYGEDTIWEGLG
ncbi:unnamed protein product, partial [marine sediment metagenome]